MKFVALALATIVAGLAVHFSGGVLPAAVRDKLGDLLWATMMFWWISALVPRARLVARGAAALVVCFGVEFGQLYHSPGLDALRATTLGGLVLGSGFDPGDLVAYGCGVVIAAFVDRSAVTSILAPT